MDLGKETIILKESWRPGKTVAIFAGVHGNETVGLIALQKLIEEVEPENGKIFFVYANPEAIRNGVREVNKNLNRLFLQSENNENETYENVRAKELMAIMDQCDALLDLHSSNSKKTKPFVICEEKGLNLAKKLNFEIVSFGWKELEKGSTDYYMDSQGKVGLCLECGSVFEPEKNLELAIDSTYLFLQEFGLLRTGKKGYSLPQTIIRVTQIGIKKTNAFAFTKKFNDFDKLTPGEIFAKDGETIYVAKDNQYIIFPRADKAIGGETFLIGEEVS